MIRYFFCYLFSISALISASPLTDEDPPILSSENHTYYLKKIIGEGAFGRVFLAVDEQGNQRAIKGFKKTHYEEGFLGVLNDPKREWERGVCLHHDHVVKAIEFFPNPSIYSIFSHFLVLEYIDAVPLALVEKRSLKREKTLQAGLQLIDALYYGLSKKLIHLDLHPYNILLDKEGNLTIIDLGSFFSVEELQQILNRPPSIQEKNPFFQPTTPAHKIERIHKKIFHLKNKIEKKRAHHQREAISFACEVFLPRYIDDITEMALYVLKSGDLSRKEFLFLSTKIKQIAWEYDYDADYNSADSANHYFYKLYEIFQESISSEK